MKYNLVCKLNQMLDTLLFLLCKYHFLIVLGNHSILKCYSLNFWGMYPFVSIVDNSLMGSRLAYWANSSVHEPKTVVLCCSPLRNGICISLKFRWAQYEVVLL